MEVIIASILSLGLLVSWFILPGTAASESAPVGTPAAVPAK